MTRAEAKKELAKYLEIQCPECNKGVGVLCDTTSMWVHYGRLMAVLDN